MCALAPEPIAIAADDFIGHVEPRTRGFYLNLVRNLSPEWLRLEVRRIAAAGFNVLIFPIFSNGWTIFPSESAIQWKMPSINPLIRKWDPLEELCSLAAEYNLTLWGLARPYNFHPRFSIAEHRLLRKYPSWRIRIHPAHSDSDLRRYENWHPCPANPDYRRYLGDLLCECAAAYPIQGLVMDFCGMAFRGGDMTEWPFCFCASCREAFAGAFEGRDLALAASESRVREIRMWQMRLATEHLTYQRYRVARIRPGLRFLALATPHWRDGPDTVNPVDVSMRVLLDWRRLLNDGMIDLLMIDHDGETFGDAFGARMAADYAHLGDRALYLPLLRPGSIKGQLERLMKLSRYPVTGFVTELQQELTDADADYIRDNYLTEPAAPPEHSPLKAAIYLLENLRDAHADIPQLHDLLTDFERIIVRQLSQELSFDTLQIIEENMHGLEQAIRRGRLEPHQIPAVSLRDLGLARRYVRLACLDAR